MRDADLTAVSKIDNEAKDPLTELLITGAGVLIAKALEAELQALLNKHADLQLQDGRRAVVRNGYLPKRRVQTAIGVVEVRVPKVRDRGDSGISFNSRLLPPYSKPACATATDTLLPWLYLSGVYSGDFYESLTALLGNNARILPTKTKSLLRDQWLEEHQQWQQRSLKNKRYLCWWVNSVHNSGQADDQRCLLVITGVTEQGHTELVAVHQGYRESSDSWTELLQSLRDRCLDAAPKLAIGDGALGFWKAVANIYPHCRQRCWGHKMAEVMAKFPEPILPVVKKALYQILMANTRQEADAIFDRTLVGLSSKYSLCEKCAEAVERLQKDRDALLAFYDFPADQWGDFRRPALLSQPASRSDCAQTLAANAVRRPSTWLWPVRLPS